MGRAVHFTLAEAIEYREVLGARSTRYHLKHEDHDARNTSLSHC